MTPGNDFDIAWVQFAKLTGKNYQSDISFEALSLNSDRLDIALLVEYSRLVNFLQKIFSDQKKGHVSYDLLFIFVVLNFSIFSFAEQILMDRTERFIVASLILFLSSLSVNLLFLSLIYELKFSQIVHIRFAFAIVLNVKHSNEKKPLIYSL